MNLQVTCPTAICRYHCPFCCARNQQKSEWENLYESNREEYFERLFAAVRDHDYKTIVLTGDCDPSQFMPWAIDVSVKLATWRYEFEFKYKVDFQTHNLDDGVFYTDLMVDRMCFSVTTLRDYLKVWRHSQVPGPNRITIILTNEFDFLDPEHFDTMGFDQVTFKALNHADNPIINRWIDEHRIKNYDGVNAIIEAYKDTGISMILDTTCQDAKSRYHIFRINGKLYDTWDAESPMNT